MLSYKMAILLMTGSFDQSLEGILYVVIQGGNTTGWMRLISGCDWILMVSRWLLMCEEADELSQHAH